MMWIAQLLLLFRFLLNRQPWGHYLVLVLINKFMSLHPIFLRIQQINKQIILKLLLQEYTKKCLETIKNNLEEDYKNTRNAETKQKPHTAQHNMLVQQMNDITVNLIKVRDAISKINADNVNALGILYEELNLKTYK